MDAPSAAAENIRLYRYAFALAIFTIFYNILEGLISTYLGQRDESLTLLGFGLDSFIEAVSGLGIAHLVWRIHYVPAVSFDRFERTALRITGWSFYALAVILIVTGAYHLYQGRRPESTFWGVVIAAVSILCMWALVKAKEHIGNKLHSDAIRADAQCNRVCIYMSLILLVSSAVYEATGFAYTDVLGSWGLAWFSYKEGKECFVKITRGIGCACHD
ncbi:MAG: cation transporter [Chitinophagales bacterium]|nr:cation transporter [Chitinophagales bacterium]MDW8419814.1 cation transporter [Chitinophagales bacterium]